MRIAFLVMAYKDPAQIERMIRSFRRGNTDFYIHLDKKISEVDFKYLGSMDQVYFIQHRIQVNWGSYRLNEAVLSSMGEIFATGKHYDFISVMSGQDYPIKPVENFYSYLERNKGANFINYEDAGGDWWRHAIMRVKRYDTNTFNFKGRSRLQALMNFLLPEKKFPLPYTLYGGPGTVFMIASIDCARYLVDFMKKHDAVRRFAIFSWAVDEFLFPTIIMNSKFKDTVINDMLYYTDWSYGETHPKTFTINDFDSLKTAPHFMARKFDIRVDTAILDKLDETLIIKSRSSINVG